jgi:hypothetical protein
MGKNDPKGCIMKPLGYTLDIIFNWSISMARAVKLSEALVQKASSHAKAMSRSTAGQIEFWANIGQIAEDNPDLPFALIRDILVSLEEAKADQLEEYVFGEGKKH